MKNKYVFQSLQKSILSALNLSIQICFKCTVWYSIAYAISKQIFKVFNEISCDLPKLLAVASLRLLPDIDGNVNEDILRQL